MVQSGVSQMHRILFQAAFKIALLNLLVGRLTAASSAGRQSEGDKWGWPTSGRCVSAASASCRVMPKPQISCGSVQLYAARQCFSIARCL